MGKVAHFSGRQFQGVAFARETWIKWSISVGNNLKAQHLLVKHG